MQNICIIIYTWVAVYLLSHIQITEEIGIQTVNIKNQVTVENLTPSYLYKSVS